MKTVCLHVLYALYWVGHSMLANAFRQMVPLYVRLFTNRKIPDTNQRVFFVDEKNVVKVLGLLD